MRSMIAATLFAFFSAFIFTAHALEAYRAQV
jgi:hypothetical protein